MRSFGLTDKGPIRSENQDCFLLELCPEKDALIAVLCDGMGGAKAGGVASQLCIKAFVSKVYEKLTGLSGKSIDYRGILQSAADETNGVVYAYSHFSEEFSGMGTTIVGGIMKSGGNGYIINIGDSRAYQISPARNTIRQITRDHSLVEELVRFGAITREEAKSHPKRNVITRALGTDERTDSDYFSFHLRTGDYLLLCSDGLSNTLSDEEMLDQAGGAKGPEELCRRLMDMALQRGARDNVTVVAVCK